MKDITKKQFIDLINAIKEEDERLRDIGKNLEKYSSSYIVFENTLGDKIIKFLESYYQDDLISWWLYDEDVDKIINDDGEEVSVKAVGELYDYLNKEN